MKNYKNMNIKQEKHLSNIKKDFLKKVDKKYRAGQKEHGGNLWLKKGIIDMALEEVLDQYVYLYTLKKQIDDGTISTVTKKDNK